MRLKVNLIINCVGGEIFFLFCLLFSDDFLFLFCVRLENLCESERENEMYERERKLICGKFECRILRIENSFSSNVSGLH